jgi:hypothetical protein
MKAVDLFSQAQTQHKAFLVNSRGYIENVFIYDNEDFEFVSGYLYDLHSWHESDRVEDMNNIDKQELNNIELYTLGLEFVCQMYVKWDGDSTIYFYNEDGEKDEEIGFYNILYKKWIRNFLFVHEITSIIHREKGGQYGISCDDEDVKELKELLLKDYKIILIKNNSSVKVES